jgi:TP901 family phage tail tape measure protein
MANRNHSTTITIGGAVSGSLMGAIGSAQSKLRDLGNALRDLKAQQQALASTTGKNTQEYQRLTSQVDRLRAAQSRLAQVERERQQNQQRRDQLQGEIGQAVGTAAAVNLPIIGSVQQAADFGYSLQLIGNTADMTDAQIQGLGQSIMAVSRSTSNSATDVQRAMGFLVAAGMETGLAEQQLGTIGKTATATGGDIEDVAKAAFVLGDALKISPQGMEDALESLVVAGKNGNFEFRDMAAELPVLGAGFNALKMTGADAVATMGAALQIARKGAANSSEAANNMANFMAKLLSPETLRKAEKLGSDLYGVISGAQARGENPFEAAIAEINRITDGGDQKLIGELFGDMQVQNFLRPMLQNLEEYNRVKQESLAADGVIQRDFERMKGTLKKQLGAIGEAIQRVAIQIGNALAPVAEKLANVLVPMIERVGAFVEANPKLVGGVLAAASALSILGVAVKVAAFGFTYLRGAWLAVSSVIAKARAGAALAQIGGQAATAVSWGTRLTSVLGMVGNTLAALGAGPVLAFGAALLAVGAAVYKYWDWVKAFFVGFGQGVMDALGPVFDKIGQQLAPLGPAIEWIGRGFGIMRDLLVEFLAPVTATAEELEGATSAGRLFGEIVGGVLGLLVDMITAPIRMFVMLGEAIGNAAGWLSENLGGAITTIGTMWTAFGVGVAAVWDGIQAKIGSVVDWLLAKIAPLMNGVAWIGEKAASLGSLVGLGGGDAPAPSAAAAGGPALPQPAMRGGANTTVNQTNSYQISVAQQPGQDGRALASEIDRQMRAREQQRARGAMYDRVAP